MSCASSTISAAVGASEMTAEKMNPAEDRPRMSGSRNASAPAVAA
jgi:hypothetical protein